MRIHIVGGFLGAGKTTIVRAAAERLAERGERVAVITNDQGSALVDTSLCRRSAESVQEIVGGCFCCRFDELEAALHGAAEAGATVAIAEAVGSCTDLVATVLAPLAERHPERFQLAPFAVVVDPWRVADVERGFLHDDVAYLFRKQIEEADVVLLSRADLEPPDVRPALLALRPALTVIPVSGVTGAGLGEWFAARPDVLASPLNIDYERYAAAEALLGWSNARVHIVGEAPFDPAEVARAFLTGLADAPIAHVKLTSLDASGGRAAIVRAGDEPTVLLDPTPVREASWLVNARVALDPVALVARLEDALTAAAAPAEVTWSDLEAFRPGRPVPQHRYAFRCGAGSEASCCAAFYDRADVRGAAGRLVAPGWGRAHPRDGRAALARRGVPGPRRRVRRRDEPACAPRSLAGARGRSRRPLPRRERRSHGACSAATRTRSPIPRGASTRCSASARSRPSTTSRGRSARCAGCFGPERASPSRTWPWRE